MYLWNLIHLMDSVEYSRITKQPHRGTNQVIIRMYETGGISGIAMYALCIKSLMKLALELVLELCFAFGFNIK